MTVIPEPMWRSAHRSSGGNVITRHRVDHGIRGDHTLCGITTADQEWHDPTGTYTCHRCAAVPPGHAVIWDLLGPTLTYRQLDHWVREGYVAAVNPEPGTGRRRYWTAEEAQVVTTMAALVAAGVSPEAATRAARNGGWLAPGVRVEVSSSQDDYHGDRPLDVVRH